VQFFFGFGAGLAVGGAICAILSVYLSRLLAECNKELDKLYEQKFRAHWTGRAAGRENLMSDDSGAKIEPVIPADKVVQAQTPWPLNVMRVCALCGQKFMGDAMLNFCARCS